MIVGTWREGGDVAGLVGFVPLVFILEGARICGEQTYPPV